MKDYHCPGVHREFRPRGRTSGIAALAVLLTFAGCSSFSVRGSDGQLSGRPPSNSLTITPNRVQIHVDESIELQARVEDMTARVEEPYRWLTGDPEIATVAGIGFRAVVTGHSVGRTTVTFKASNGLEAIVNVTVR